MKIPLFYLVFVAKLWDLCHTSVPVGQKRTGEGESLHVMSDVGDAHPRNHPLHGAMVTLPPFLERVPGFSDCLQHLNSVIIELCDFGPFYDHPTQVKVGDIARLSSNIQKGLEKPLEHLVYHLPTWQKIKEETEPTEEDKTLKNAMFFLFANLQTLDLFVTQLCENRPGFDAETAKAARHHLFSIKTTIRRVTGFMERELQGMEGFNKVPKFVIEHFEKMMEALSEKRRALERFSNTELPQLLAQMFSRGRLEGTADEVGRSLEEFGDCIEFVQRQLVDSLKFKQQYGEAAKDMSILSAVLSVSDILDHLVAVVLKLDTFMIDTFQRYLLTMPMYRASVNALGEHILKFHDRVQLFHSQLVKIPGVDWASLPEKTWVDHVTEWLKSMRSQGSSPTSKTENKPKISDAPPQRPRDNSFNKGPEPFLKDTHASPPIFTELSDNSFSPSLSHANPKLINNMPSIKDSKSKSESKSSAAASREPRAQTTARRPVSSAKKVIKGPLGVKNTTSTSLTEDFSAASSIAYTRLLMVVTTLVAFLLVAI